MAGPPTNNTHLTPKSTQHVSSITITNQAQQVAVNTQTSQNSKQQRLSASTHNIHQQQVAPSSLAGSQYLFGSHHYSQPSIQNHEPLDHRVVAAYGVIIVCMIILVVLLLLRMYFERTAQRQWNQESSIVEDEATLQNHQNIYKSRTSLSTDKAPYDVVDSGCSSAASSNGDGLQSAHDRRLYGHHHNLNGTGPLNPPPPYTISHSHPNSTYNNSTYNNSIYNHPSTNHNTLSSNAPSTTNATSSSLYNNSTTTSSNPYGRITRATNASSLNPYGTTGSAHQSPYYVIYHFL